MKTKISVAYIAFLFFSLGLTPVTQAQIIENIDLSTWSALSLSLGGQNPGKWVLSNNNETVTQTVNADPSFYLNNLDQTSFQIDGRFRVDTSSDDDFIGFVFGYQAVNRFYVFDWKQSTQNAGLAYGTAERGFTIRKINSPTVNDLTLRDFWHSEGTVNSTILATSYGTGKGWADRQFYDFHLDFQPGSFNIVVKNGSTMLWDVVVNDSSYTFGQFGFYNFSQEKAQYEGFVQTGGVIIPEPATVGLWSLGFLAAGLLARRRKRPAQG